MVGDRRPRRQSRRRARASRRSSSRGSPSSCASPRPERSSDCSARSRSRSACWTSSTSCSRSSVLGMGDGGAGYLNAAFGLGGALAIAVTATLVGRARLIPAIVGALAAWAAAFMLLALLSTVGGAHASPRRRRAPRTACSTSAGRTLLQRTAPPEVLARVFGVLECLMSAGIALGAMLAPLLVHLGGTTAAIVGTGPAPPLLALIDRQAAASRSMRRPRCRSSRSACCGRCACSRRSRRRRSRESRIASSRSRRGRDGDRDAGRGGRPLLRDRGGRGRGSRRRRARHHARSRRRLR